MGNSRREHRYSHITEWKKHTAANLQQFNKHIRKDWKVVQIKADFSWAYR